MKCTTQEFETQLVEIPVDFCNCLTQTQQIYWLFDELEKLRALLEEKE